MVREKEKRLIRGELLALKEHGGAGREQEQGCQRAMAPRTRQAVQPQPAAGVRHLIMVLDVSDETGRLDIEARIPPSPLLPRVVLALEQIAPLDGGEQFLRRAQKVAVIALMVPGKGDEGAV